MKTIWKYEIPNPNEIQTISVPAQAKALRAEMQDSRMIMWFEVESDNYFEKRIVRIVGTGDPLEVNGIDISKFDYVSTVFIVNLVFHVYINHIDIE